MPFSMSVSVFISFFCLFLHFFPSSVEIGEGGGGGGGREEQEFVCGKCSAEAVSHRLTLFLGEG